MPTMAGQNNFGLAGPCRNQPVMPANWHNCCCICLLLFAVEHLRVRFAMLFQWKWLAKMSNRLRLLLATRQLRKPKKKTQEIKLQPASRVQPEEDKAVNIFRCQKGQDKEKPPN